jgi:predicted permease
MTSTRQRIPLALRLAAWLLPRDAREEILGDLVEAWHAREHTQSRWRRAVWTLRQPVEALRARLRPRSRGTASGTPPLGVIRGRRGLGFSWLDVKLGVRMLGKQPILTIVAGLTLALGIPAALIPTHAIGLFQLALPVDEGDRVLGLRNWDLEANRPSLRLLHDFAVWNETLGSFESLAAVRSEAWNVHSPDGRAAEVRGAEVTASVFPLLRVPPLLGRTLLAADETAGAADVVVISEDLWASRFTRDPEIVGKVATIGRRPHTIVGVMPAGFYFPMRDHLWLPLRAHAEDYAVGAGPDLFVVGRLTDGVSRSQAEAELRTVGARLAMAWPETHAGLRAELVSFPILALGERAAGPMASWEVVLLQLFAFALLAVVCGNIGTLILARTATRLNEISVRTALGASRARILGQLFIESLVLAAGATLLGLLIAQEVAVPVAYRVLEGDLPYWFDIDLSLQSILIALGVGAGCAVLAGVLPAVKATSPRIQQNLQRNTRGGTVKFGALTTILIVTEVALSVGFLCFGTAAMMSFSRDRSDESEVAVDRYVVASLTTPWMAPTGDEDAEAYEAQFRTRTAQNHEDLRDRLAAHPSVRRVAMGRHVPGVGFADRPMVLEGTGATDDAPSGWAATGQVHVDYFRDMGMRVLQGRGFTVADVEGPPGAPRSAIVVNEAFAERVLGGGNALGRRLRYAVGTGGAEQWLEIVGVVETFGTNFTNPDRSEALYQPLGSADLHPMRYIIEVADDPVTFLPTLRTIAADVDPEAIIQSAQPLTDLLALSLLELRVASILVFVLSAIGMLLAATGLYALMSFTVSQRTREIGIRTALGARAADVVKTIAKRALLQLLAGVALGCVFGWWIVGTVTNDTEFAVESVPGLVAGVAVAVVVFSALACLSPTLRGLRIQPTEALSES